MKNRIWPARPWRPPRFRSRPVRLKWPLRMWERDALCASTTARARHLPTSSKSEEGAERSCAGRLGKKLLTTKVAKGVREGRKGSRPSLELFLEHMDTSNTRCFCDNSSCAKHSSCSCLPQWHSLNPHLRHNSPIRMRIS